MTQYSAHSTTFLRFLSLAEAVRGLPSLPGLDVFEERLLHVFAASWHSGERLSVLKAASLVEGMSESTIYRRLKSLRKKGYVSLAVDELDNRVKYILPTPVCDHYFEMMGRCLSEAQRP